MTGFEDLLKAILAKEVRCSMYQKMFGEMKGKTEEERDKVAEKYAKIIVETCPPREKTPGNSRRRLRRLASKRYSRFR